MRRLFGCSVLCVLAPLVSVAAVTGGCIDYGKITGGAQPDGGGGSSSPDGGAGASEAGGSGSFCSTFTPGDYHAFFCSDFDEGATLPSPWAAVSQTGATFAQNGGAVVSVPDSLDEVVPSLTVGGSVDVILRTSPTIPPLPTSMKFGMSLDPVTIDPQDKATIVLESMDFVDASQNRYSVYLSGVVISGALTLELDEQATETDGGVAFHGHALPATTLPSSSSRRSRARSTGRRRGRRRPSSA